MASETIKRWGILIGLLAITLWLVLNAPVEDDGYDLVTVSPKRSLKTIPVTEVPETNFMLKKRLSAGGEPIDIFAIEKKKLVDVQPARKVMVIAKPKPRVKLKPVAPRLPFKYIGQLVENNMAKIFLMEGQVLHVARVGDKLGKNYQLKQVASQKIHLLYLPLNTIQTMNIGKTP